MQPPTGTVQAQAVLDHAAGNIGDQSAVTAAAAGHRGLHRLVAPRSAAGRARRNRRAVRGGPPRPPTGVARLDPARPARPHPARKLRGVVAGRESPNELALPPAAALAFAAVGKRVFVVYASFGSGAEPQVLGVASSASRAEELAERYTEEDRCAWRRPDWLEWDSARRAGCRRRGLAGGRRSR